MIAIAQRRVPETEFRVGSLFEADLPRCDAVTSIGEVFTYLFGPRNDHQALVRLFRRVCDALTPGRVFVFDIAEPGQVMPGPQTGGSPKQAKAKRVKACSYEAQCLTNETLHQSSWLSAISRQPHQLGTGLQSFGPG
jgi:hypothetical protein